MAGTKHETSVNVAET